VVEVEVAEQTRARQIPEGMPEVPEVKPLVAPAMVPEALSVQELPAVVEEEVLPPNLLVEVVVVEVGFLAALRC
jgi:hypothetical protein